MDENMDPKYRSLLRRKILANRDAIPDDGQYERSGRICAKLFMLEQIQNARTVFVYMHFRSEVQTTEFINLCLLLGKNVTIPYTVPAEKQLLAVQITDPELDVAPGYHGIPEPAKRLLHTTGSFNPQRIDVAIIPGSVFDRSGGRLGYGGGYYDRFLEREASHTFRIGLAYEMQLVDKVPVEQHDQLMDMVVTEENIYDCRRNRHAKDCCLS